ncbi:MAG: glutathione S-transferase family protein [Pseudomonadota bacterium]|nr:glutathione S-transferase family protein [Pseudomonadota bacterium]
MGLLVKGQWHDQWYDTAACGGAFEREDARLRNWISADGSTGFAADSGRYHLYVSLACPWAHRTLIFRELKNLSAHISVSVVATDMLEQGWTFDSGNGSSGDALYQSQYLHQIYTRHDATYSGRVTVPVLWDKQTASIVSNESSEIIRMFNSAFNGLTGNALDFYPPALQQQIDAINERVYHSVNNGVYKAGFATSQEKYQQAFDQLFTTLDWLEQRLTAQRWLVTDDNGTSHLTEADWRLFTTLIRFDAVYVGHFKCNLKRIADYPALSGFVRDLYQYPGIAETVNMEHIKRHYYFSHKNINPTGIIPAGPQLDFSSAHSRHQLP